MDKELICTSPFTDIEIDGGGNIRFCCSAFVNDFSIGSLFEKSFDEIWNGEKANKFRKCVIENNYSKCNRETCTFKPIDNLSVTENIQYPKKIELTIDNSCNLKCITCRDKLITKPNANSKKLYELILKNEEQIFKNAELLTLDINGDCLFSSLSKNFIKFLSEKYPCLKFSIMTNGIFCNKKNIENLKISDKIQEISVSIHATTKETYNTITRTGNFDILMNNLKWLSEEKRKGNIPKVIINFVVQSINYKEMPLFVKLAQDLDIIASFWEFQNWHTTKMHKNYNEYTVWDKNHPQFDNFTETLKNPIFDDKKHCELHTLFYNMRKDVLKNKKEKITNG